MGHHFSKSVTTSSNGSNNNHTTNSNSNKTPKTNSSVLRDTKLSTARTSANTTRSNRISIPATPTVGPTINLQISQEEISSGNINATLSNSSSSNSFTSVNNSGSCPRQIIIKIQLAKMENGNEQEQHQQQHHHQLQQQQQHQSQLHLLETHAGDTLARENELVDTNSNRRDANAQILNVTVQSRNFSSNAGATAINNNQIEFDQSTSESAEYCEVLEEASTSECAAQMAGARVDHVCLADADNNNCCRRKSKSSSSSATKARCCKCTCRDAIRRILEPSSRSHKSKERRDHHNKHSNSNNNSSNNNSSSNNSSSRNNNSNQCDAWLGVNHQQNQQLQPLRNSNSSSNNSSAPRSNPQNRTARVSSGNDHPSGSNHMSIWAQSHNDVFIPLNPPQFVLLQCPPVSLVTLGHENAIRLMTDFGNSGNGVGGGGNGERTLKTTVNGQTVHSQVDFMHCLVPDLERITNSSFYWGKMDRYEAERLLEGKQEGTFLLRDSAQEEFLFSVTFRKYGRSLHARIEQSGHKFSFDCHDPSVFTAPTVTGLLEHYKDPACVMFFEPMLTTPLHRKTTFSLQELCRSTIVSNTTYDGINELELPTRLQSFLKEYHYKQKLRVKPFDEPFYSHT